MAVRSRRSLPSAAAAALAAASLLLLALAPLPASASLTPLIDYIIPVWPSVSCGKPGFDPPICPTADGICQAPVPSAPLANYLSQVQARVAAFPNFFYFTAQCRNSLVLKGAAECYFVFDQTALRTGIAAIKNVGPYPGITLLTCVLQLDAGPPKTSSVCFDKGGVDPAHPYVVARVESGVPEYNLQQVRFIFFCFFFLGRRENGEEKLTFFKKKKTAKTLQVKFGWIVQDDNVAAGSQPLQYTLSFQGPNVNPPGCAFI